MTPSSAPWNSKTAPSAPSKPPASPSAARTACGLEINGERGSLAFDLERLNEFQYLSLADDAAHQGFRTVLATEPSHPWLSDWWPPGHILGWEHTFTHEIAHLLRCIQNDEPVAPIGADFVDGYRCAAICDAIQQSATTGRRVNVQYED